MITSYSSVALKHTAQYNISEQENVNVNGVAMTSRNGNVRVQFSHVHGAINFYCKCMRIVTRN